MARSALDCTPRAVDVGLHGSCVVATGEFLTFRLHALDDGACEELLVDPAVQLEDAHDALLGLLVRDVRRVALLPEELAGSQERSGILKLPANHVAPLIDLKGHIAVAANPLGEEGIHDRLARGANGNVLREIRITRLGHPCHFRGKACDVVLLGLQGVLAHEEGEIRVLDTELLDLVVEPALDLLPDRIRPGAQNVATRNVTVINHLAESDGLRVPVGEVLLLLDGQAQHGLSLHVLRGVVAP